MEIQDKQIQQYIDTAKTAKKKIIELETEIKEARKGVFGFMIKNDETLTEGMNRNYAEFDDCRSQLQVENKDLKRRLLSHCKGEAVEGQCFECKKSYWYVDDEPIVCPYCGE